MRKARFIPMMLLCLMVALPGLATQTKPAGSYQYSPSDEVVTAVPAYAHERSLYAEDLLGVTSLTNLRDAQVTPEHVYILRGEELLIFNHEFELLQSLSEYMDAEGQAVKLTGGTGLAIGREGDYYISRAEQGDILHFDAQGKLIRLIGRPDIRGFENVAYKPVKLAVDEAQRIYVVAQGMYEGIVELNPNGTFSRFFGVNRVQFTVWQYFWRLFATREQLARQQLWLPTDFTNLDIDSRGFIFATSQGQEIKRLNARGENIMERVDGNYPEGDIRFNRTGVGIPVGPSAFIAVDSNEYGVFICLDQTRSRVFGYNEEGRLLFILGGPGQREGLFRNPVDTDFVGDRIMVLDALAQSIELYAPTTYGQAINNAVRLQYAFDYEQAAVYWREALALDHNFTLAYSGIGRSLLRNGRYEDALDYLKLGADRQYYSKAFEKVRDQQLKEWFVPAVAGLIGLIVVVKVVKAIKRRGRKEAAA